MTERRAELERKREQLEAQIVWDSFDKPLSGQIDQVHTDLEMLDADSCDRSPREGWA
jgi:hypothetical protein